MADEHPQKTQSRSFLIGLFALAFMFLYLMFGIPEKGMVGPSEQGRNMMLEFFATYIDFGLSFILLARYFYLQSTPLLYFSLAFFSLCLIDLLRGMALHFMPETSSAALMMGLLSYANSKLLFVGFLLWSSFCIDKLTPPAQLRKEWLRGFVVMMAATAATGAAFMFAAPLLLPSAAKLELARKIILPLGAICLAAAVFVGTKYLFHFLRRHNMLSLWMTMGILLFALNDAYFLSMGPTTSFSLNFGLLFRILASTTFGVGVIDDYLRYLVQGREISNNLEQLVVKRTQELEKKNRELEEITQKSLEASRLKSELLANMSHELRTPMNAIIGFTSRVIKKCETDLPERQLKNLKTVEKNAHHLLGLINSILDVSKVEAGKMEILVEPFHVAELIREVVDMSLPLVGNKNLRVLWECEEDIYMNSDRTKIKQMLINLVSNSIKFTEEGGVKVAVKRSDLNPYLLRPGKKEEGVFGTNAAATHTPREQQSVQFAISDTGIGIREENLKFIFDEFRQVDGSLTRQTGGTGLGLSIVKKFSELLGGGVEVTSQYKRGTCFTVLLPLDSSFFVQRALRSNKQRRAEDAGKIGSVLCVSDDARTASIIRRYFEEADFMFDIAKTAEEALQKARASRPSFIIIDFTMTQCPLFQIVQDIKMDTYLKETPFLGYGLTEDKGKGFSVLLYETLAKPATAQSILMAIHKAKVFGKGERVMVVEDDLATKELFSGVLKQSQTEGVFTFSGKEVVEAFQVRRPDLIFFDFTVYTEEAFEFFNQKNEIDPLRVVPVVAMISQPGEPQVQERLRLKALEAAQKNQIQAQALFKAMVEQVLAHNLV